MKMVEAAELALKSLGQPASVREIYEEILRQDLFSFGAKDPVSVLGGAIRRRARGSMRLRGEAVFESTGKGTFRLI